MSLPLKCVFSRAALNGIARNSLKAQKITPNVRKATALWIVFASLGMRFILNS